MGTEDAIVFTTGYQSNLGAISAILEPGDTVICDSGDHASILDGCKLSGARLRPFRHNRMDKLETMLERAAGRRERHPGRGRRRLLDGGRRLRPAADRRALPALRRAADGGRGPRGRACSARGAPAPASSSASRTRSTCGWAPSPRASPPAAASSPAPAEVIEYLRISSRAFIFSASAVPAAVGAALGALRIIRAEGPGAVRAPARQRRLPAAGLPRPGPQGRRARDPAGRHARRPPRSSR